MKTYANLLIKLKILIAVMIFFSVGSYSQNIGINTTGVIPDSSAILDLNTGNTFGTGTSKGILIPKVALTGANDNSTIIKPANSLLVYNTGTGGLTQAGYYYNAGSTSSPNWTLLFSSNMGGSNLFNAGTGLSWNSTTLNSIWTVNGSDIYNNNSGNVGVGTTSPGQKLSVAGTIESTSGGIKFPDGNILSGISYAQLEANVQTFAANAWTSINWASASIANGISVSGTNITFTQTGIYRISVTFRCGGADVWSGARLYGNGITRGNSSGYGDGVLPTNAIFFADVASTAFPYQLQIGKATGGGVTQATPGAIAGVTLPAIVATIEKIN